MSSSNKRPPPTKIELIKVKRSLVVAKSVYKILEDKRDVLLKIIDEMIDEAGKARSEMSEPLSKAYRSLFNAYMSIGSSKLESIALTSPSHIDVDVNVKVVVDVRIPTISISEKEIGLNKWDGGKSSWKNHNNMNVLCMGGRVINISEAEKIVSSFLEANFISENKYVRRLNKINKLD